MSKNLIFLLLFFSLLSLNCQKFPDYGGTYNKSITIDGIERDYIIHLPLGYYKNKDQNYPLLVVLHGGGGSSRQIMNETEFNKFSNKRNFIVIYPDALNKKWADARNTTESSTDEIDDVKFIKTLIDTLSLHYNLDKQRIYVTGISNGGFMTQTLLCEAFDYFSAGASVVATLPENLRYSIPQNKVSVIIIVGTDDPIVPYEGGEMLTPSSGGFIVSAQETALLWAKANSCDTLPKISDLPDISDDKTTITLYEYLNCNKKVNLYVVNDGGHAWPGGSQYLPVSIIGKRSKDIDASEEICNFFDL